MTATLEARPDAAPSPFGTIEQAIAEFRAGKLVLIVDDEERENEGDLAVAAEHATPAAINFMATHGRGLVCLPIIGQRLDELQLPLMVPRSEPSHATAFTVSVDARSGITTGISAPDRARTIQVILDPRSRPEDLVRPGHLFPLRYTEGGVLARPGHTEASVDLAKLAGLYPAAVICEVMNPDGTMARLPELLAFARTHRLTVISVAQLIAHRRRTETLVTRVAHTTLPTEQGEFQVYAYEAEPDGGQHLALVLGNVQSGPPPLVRVHSECLTGDVFGSRRCDCGEQLQQALGLIERDGRGVVVYLRHHEGRGIGLVNKLRAYGLQDNGLDTVEANAHLGFPPDPRDYGVAAQILADLGLRRIRLLTNNPRKLVGVQGFGLEVVERVPLVVTPNERNRVYLQTKRDKLGHLL